MKNIDESPKHELIVRPDQPKWYEKVPKFAWMLLLLLLVGLAIFYFSPSEKSENVTQTAEQQRIAELEEQLASASQGQPQQDPPAQPYVEAPVQHQATSYAPPAGPKKFTELQHREHGAVVLSTQPVTRPDGSRWLLLHGPGGVVMYPVDRNRSAESIQRTMSWKAPQPQPPGQLEVFDTTTHQATNRAMHVYAWRLR